ncbi:hypothetical protein LCGC14_1674140 [marine sediment metagenome]|uniref:Uncharacterized protein n=1 Tax=marine sediment metagenome TaxID=412755 RepID=A0A0F9HQJ6_9ZZZZ
MTKPTPENPDHVNRYHEGYEDGSKPNGGSVIAAQRWRWNSVAFKTYIRGLTAGRAAAKTKQGGTP